MAGDIEKIRSLRQKWFGATAGFKEAVESCFDRIGFTAGYVETLVKDASSGKYSHKSKVIKDNTWGMIEVDWQTVRLLDCPVVQRLRAVKQLGFTYLTYPSAEHSRFVHSLGMFAVVSRFMEASSRQSEEEVPSTEGIQKYTLKHREKTDVLHAAILHDVGHLPFSHAAEVPLTTDSRRFFCGPLSVDDFLFAAEETLGKELQLSEALSLAIVLSPRFGQFYRDFVRPGNEDADVTLRISALIAGMYPAAKLRGPADLISSSSVDADKIDYINRDALACGIPVGLDVARLFLRSSFYEVRLDKLRRLGIQDATGDEVIFVVNASGVDTLDELAQARAALYQRVYLHQTTRNAERLLALGLESLPATREGVAEPLRDAMFLLSLDDAALIAELSNHSDVTVRDSGSRIRARRLPARSCVFGRSLVTTLMPMPEIIRGVTSELAKQTLGMIADRLRSDVLKGDAIRTLEKSILEEAETLGNLIRAQEPELVPDAPRPTIVSVLAMRELDGLTREAIVLENNELIYSSDRSISDEQNEATDLYKALGFVLTDRDWREIVCLASRKVFATTITEPPRAMSLIRRSVVEMQTHIVKGAGRLILDQTAITRRASLNADRVEALQSLAGRLGYFDNVPWLLPADISESVELASKLQKFDGQGGWTVGATSCAAFLSQFPPNLRKEMSDLLTKEMRVIDREMINSGLRAVISNLQSKYGRIFVTGLTPDSGNIVRMLFEHEARGDLQGQNVRIEKSISAALESMKDDDLLLLCDDLISSGSQAQCQFRCWFGIPRSEWPVAQRTELGVTVGKLDDRLLDRMRTCNVALAICVGSESAERDLAREVASLGVSRFQGVHIANRLETNAGGISKELTGFLSEVGASLIAYTRFAKQLSELTKEERAECDNNALGYGNAKGLLVTFVNVPTSTLTCIWCPGIVRGNPWMPLTIRRGYLEHLIVA